ncbi:transposase, partial [Methylobacterium tardum]|uniref:transposase n=1 Tax=Methylobacterium tardum TaxID=374432 RepID=UPI001EDDA147
MAKHPKPEEIVAKLRQADVLISQGQSVSDAIRAIGVSSVTYYRWRREFGGLKSDQVRRMRDLETENQRLRKAIADLTLDKLILQEASRGNFLYSGFIGQRPFVRILVRRVIGPVELLLLSEVSER